MGTVEQRTRALKAEARRVGFGAVGIARAGSADPEGHLRAWLAAGYGGEMSYLARTLADREDATHMLPGARSVVALMYSYWRPESEETATRPTGKIARYAPGRDYHALLRRKVRSLRKFLLRLDPEAEVHPTIDTSPVLERAWAARAGIAWIGKSTMAIAPRLGTYTFLATLVTTSELAADTPILDHCGSCTRCLDACPTQAFPRPYVLDATRCITYWNVERPGPFTEETPELEGWLAGCDVCQEVCPWNKWKQTSPEPRFGPTPAMRALDLPRLADPQETEYHRAVVDKTPLARTGGEALSRNARALLAVKSKLD